MKKQITRSMDIDRIPIQRLTALLETFTLKHSSRSLADLLEKAEVNELSYREFLLTLLETEVRGRNERRRKRNLSAAHFPPHPKILDDFDPTELDAGITESQIQSLRELSWLDTCGNLVFGCPKNRIMPEGADEAVAVEFFRHLGEPVRWRQGLSADQTPGGEAESGKCGAPDRLWLLDRASDPGVPEGRGDFNLRKEENSCP